MTSLLSKLLFAFAFVSQYYAEVEEKSPWFDFCFQVPSDCTKITRIKLILYRVQVS